MVDGTIMTRNEYKLLKLFKFKLKNNNIFGHLKHNGI